MTTQPLFRAVLAALALFATAGHAQGLGGMLNQAKAKVGQATSAGASPTAATRAVTQTAQGGNFANNEPPPHPKRDVLTDDTNKEYTLLMLNDPRPVVVGNADASGEGGYAYRAIKKEYAIKFTWDQAALSRATKSGFTLFDYVQDACTDLRSSLRNNYEPALRARLPKVKEIHFTPTDKQSRLSTVPGVGAGWYFSFEPTTGVLTAAFNLYPTSMDNNTDHFLSLWIIQNVKK